MWAFKKLDEMSNLELFKCLRLRIDTFVVEQDRLYHELDDVDPYAYHIFHLDETGQVDTYARVYPQGDKVSFGRVVTASTKRKSGLGRPLMEQILLACEKVAKDKEIEIESQVQVVGFYEKFCFRSVGEVFTYNKTPHQKMILTK